MRMRCAAVPDLQLLLVLLGVERHPQVGAEDVDDRLPVLRVPGGEPFERVQPGQPDRRLVAAELVGGLAVHLGDPALGGVVVLLHQLQLGRPLPPGGEQQGGRAAGADDDVGGGLQRVQPGRVLRAATAEQRQQHRRGGPGRHQQPGAPQHDRPGPQHPFEVVRHGTG
ncbi:hypothetical protein [Amycolatopsis sp. NPDC004169]|uniref:hypothetical protein n=1 Tax=Amycolatopsis sp. NPDC004169 TaxID=3154453 RepID=UPI0033AD7AE4